MDFKGPTKLLQEDISEKWNLHINKIMKFIYYPGNFDNIQLLPECIYSDFNFSNFKIYEQIVMTTMLLRMCEYIDFEH